MKHYWHVAGWVVVLLVAVGISSAQALPGKNTVDSGDIKDGTVKGSDVKDDSLTGTDIREGSLDLGYSVVEEGFTVASGQYFNAHTVHCPPGTEIVGGGVANYPNKFVVQASFPVHTESNTDDDYWFIQVATYDKSVVASDQGFIGKAICMNVG